MFRLVLHVVNRGGLVCNLFGSGAWDLCLHREAFVDVVLELSECDENDGDVVDRVTASRCLNYFVGYEATYLVDCRWLHPWD